MTRGRPGRARVALLVALVAQGLVVAWLVFNPSPAVPSGAAHAVSAWVIRQGLGDWDTVPSLVGFGLNVAMLLPLGLTVRLLAPGIPFPAFLLIGFFLSGVIEATQLFLLKARYASFLDIVANSAGFAVGAFVGLLVHRLVRRSQSQTALSSSL